MAEGAPGGDSEPQPSDPSLRPPYIESPGSPRERARCETSPDLGGFASGGASGSSWGVPHGYLPAPVGPALTTLDAGLEDVLHAWRVHGLARGDSTRTIESRIYTIRRLRSCGIDPLTTDADALLEWLARLTDHRTGDAVRRSTRATYRSQLRAFFRWAKASGRRDDDPSPSCRRPGPPRCPPSHYPRGCAGHPAGLCRFQGGTDPRLRVLLGAYAGLRVHEIAQIRGEDCTDGLIFVTGKGGVESSIPMHPLVADLARRMPRLGLGFLAVTGGTSTAAPSPVPSSGPCAAPASPAPPARPAAPLRDPGPAHQRRPPHRAACATTRLPCLHRYRAIAGIPAQPEHTMRRLAAAVFATLALVPPSARQQRRASSPMTTRGRPVSSAREYAAMGRPAGGPVGAGDVSLSVPLGMGGSCGCTATRCRPADSSTPSAIVQTRWSLHVSHRGRQVLPDEASAGGRRIWYWIEAARSSSPASSRSPPGRSAAEPPESGTSTAPAPRHAWR